MTQQRHVLTDAQWQHMVVHLPPVLGRPGRDDRLVIDAVLWIAKTGAPWRDLPPRLGAWAQVYQRFARWSERGHFNTLFLALQEPDHEQLMVDSTSCKAHQASAGAQKKGTSSNWRLSRWAEHQNPCGMRRAGQSFALQINGWQQSRYAGVAWTDPGFAWAGAAGRQSL